MAKVRPFVLFGFALLFIALFLPGFAKMQELRARNASLAGEINRLRGYNEKLRDEKYRLEHDMGYIEKVAREKLGMVKEHEVVYRMVPQDKMKSQQRSK